MKRMIPIAAGLALLAGTAAPAQEAPAPSEVAFGEYGAVAEPLTGTPGDAEQGEKIVSSKSMGNCIACHQISALPEVPFQGTVGPALDEVGGYRSAEELRGIVADAKKTFPDTIMPSFYKNTGYIRPGNGFTGKAAEGPLDPLLTAQQVEDVVAYLLTLHTQ